MVEQEEILSIRNIFKVFGDDPKTALAMIEDGSDKDAVFRETGQTIGVFDANFSVHKGEIFVIMGLSGSGKSTLVRLLNRLIEPTSGSIHLNGKEITGLAEKDLIEARRQDMSMVFQSFALMPHMNVLRNAAFGLEVSGVALAERNRRALQALKQVGLGNHSDSYPDQLSGGMQQRVGLARALANDPTILLMDEAFSALDPLIRVEMQQELKNLQREQNRTIVFISHDLDEAIHIGDRIAIMENGVIVQIGTPVEILLNPADDYVRTFFKGVDVARILKARNIAQMHAENTLRLGANRSLTKQQADAFVCVVDADNHFQGIVPSACLSDGVIDDAELQSSYMASPFTVKANDSLKDIMSLVSESAYPVPVVDHNHKLLGVISAQHLLGILAGTKPLQ